MKVEPCFERKRWT